MITTLRTTLLPTIFIIFFANFAKVQPHQGKSIDVAIGYGISTPYENVDIYGSGFFAQGEYVLGLTRWFGLRPYAGFIITSADENDDYIADYKATSKAFLLGGKFRIAAPIPWVAPYLEAGVGASLGKFETYTPYVDIEKSGLLVHIPFTLGLALGPENNVVK
ncbi:hypothetical protein LCGC14_3009540 [marine sediment metagenome]|uniref:Outer membrane protein beta-barrel domain-containing protein n=1 Tax=marine sediment metagenome TaxID=412755 RepID=A0A0F8WZ42_9ZZZZ